ncbi:uncharacterized protein LOC131650952 [Vicia villosa]|uniref:uncharacterized protein LOC131650952 n=1 Tax=Vicia villosa TaxID=3911 RepID=UPI00273BE46C|nr:uncharacterized protein LOC131650952 [Vicia villosa]
MWNNLLAVMKRFKDGEWVMGGDFNAIKNSSERKGRAVMHNNREIIGQFIGDRDLSDHCPIWLLSDKSNWGPKPFRFNNEWFSKYYFIPFVEKEWNSLKVGERGDFVLKEKLKLFKEKLKWWNKEVFGKFDLEMEGGVRDINIADQKLDSDDIDHFNENLDKRREACCRFWKNLGIRENMLLKKSKLKWIQEGDSNSGFFHKVMKEKRRRNHIGPIFTSGGVVDSVEEVKEAVFNNFCNKFIDSEEERPVLDGVDFKSLSVEEAVGLEKPFLDSEIKEAIWDCGGDKSPGPDGYSFLFFKKCWNIIKEDFINFFKHFFEGSSISKAISSSF